LTGGGTAGNQQLTALLGVILTVLLLVIGVTILRVQQLISVHLFVGLLLIGPVGAKLASTGYRFFRYYTNDGEYRHKGPPALLLRLSAPVLVLTTASVFISGVILLFVGPANRGQLVLIHKASFFVWAARSRSTSSGTCRRCRIRYVLCARRTGRAAGRAAASHPGTRAARSHCSAPGRRAGARARAAAAVRRLDGTGLLPAPLPPLGVGTP